MEKIREDLIGQKIGKLLVVSYNGFISEQRKDRIKKISSYLCKCDCGNEKIATTSQLLRIKSCGCGQKEYWNKKIKNSLEKTDSKDEEELLWKRCYSEYKTEAERRNYSFNISLQEFITISTKNCHYCGDIPKVSAKMNIRRNKIKTNGIDRVNNKIGYEIDNIVPCCFMCNLSKYRYTIEQWNEWLDRITNFRKNNI